MTQGVESSYDKRLDVVFEERSSHPPGMLTRDQRTAFTTVRSIAEGKILRHTPIHLEEEEPHKHRTRRRTLPGGILSPRTCVNKVSNIVKDIDCDVKGSESDKCSVRPVDSERRRSRRYRNYARRISTKFGDVLACLCLLAVLQSAAAAPVRATATATATATAAAAATAAGMQRRGGEPARQRRALPDQPKWVNPCGIMGTNANSMAQDMMPGVDVSDLLQQIVIQARNALVRAEESKREYVQVTFGVDFEVHAREWNNQYEWLSTPEHIPKGLDEHVSQTHLDAIEHTLDDTLLKTYKYLQRVAVGLEQVTRDQSEHNGQFINLFQDTEYGLRSVLCEIQAALLEQRIEWGEDVTREIMGDEYRHIPDSTYRDLRDWFIYRDYMNALQYIIQVYEFYAKSLA